jgi:Zn-dependent protease with chaperone function
MDQGPLTADLLAQGIVHTLVAALFVEALLRTWEVRHPAQRMALRLIAFAQPLVLFPALLLIFPHRGEASFHDLALLSGRRWSDVAFLGLDLYRLFVGGLAALGALLLLADLLALARSLRRRRPPEAPLDGRRAEALERALAPALAQGAARPPVRLLDLDSPLVYCAGVRRPTIHLSRGAVDLLDAAELQAALAHELAHVGRRDPERSWVVLGLRGLMAYNPTFQVLARTLARDAERLADEPAAELGADRLALAAALLRLHRATGGGVSRRTLLFGGARSGRVRRAHDLDIEQRARALLGPPPARLPYFPLRLTLAGGAVSALLYFVV